MAELKPEPTLKEPDAGDREGSHRHHRTSGVSAGLTIILLGVLLFLENQRLLRSDQWWMYFLIGLGVIFLLDAALRHQQGAAVRGRIIAGVIVGGLGVAFLFGWSNWWPLILIVVGVGIIVGGLVRH